MKITFITLWKGGIDTQIVDHICNSPKCQAEIKVDAYVLLGPKNFIRYTEMPNWDQRKDVTTRRIQEWWRRSTQYLFQKSSEVCPPGVGTVVCVALCSIAAINVSGSQSQRPALDWGEQLHVLLSQSLGWVMMDASWPPPLYQTKWSPNIHASSTSILNAWRG